MQEKKKQCDVLVVGGGIAGLMAAIRAAELGAKVIVAEKSNTLRSGSASVGNDHFQCYIPEVHGEFKLFWKELFYGQLAAGFRLLDEEYLRFWFENSFDIVKMWDSWGIPMKYEGRYEFTGHGFPAHQLNHLRYAGANQKPVLTREALKRGAEIMNRVMVFDLFKAENGSVNGAIGLSTREDKMIVFEAKSVILGTGRLISMYPAVTYGADYNRPYPMTLTGDGRAMAYRAGAELKDLELPARHAGVKSWTRTGQASWIGVLRDRSGNPVGPFITKPDKRYSDMTTEVNKGIFEEYKRTGKGPVYMDMNGVSNEDLQYMVHWLKNEGNSGLLNHLDEEGVNLAKAAIEFQSYELSVSGGIKANYKGETAVKGLYAVGDEVFNTMSHAAVFGLSAGENAAKYVKTLGATDKEKTSSQILDKKALLEEIRDRKDGAKWQEALSSLQNIMLDYCGFVRSESMLSAGLDVIQRLKRKERTVLMAENPHDLIHCVQVLNQTECGELTFISALDRKETRGMHVRSDFTITNPLLADKLHIIKQVGGNPVTEWIEVKR